MESPESFCCLSIIILAVLIYLIQRISDSSEKKKKDSTTSRSAGTNRDQSYPLNPYSMQSSQRPGGHLETSTIQPSPRTAHPALRSTQPDPHTPQTSQQAQPTIQRLPTATPPPSAVYPAPIWSPPDPDPAQTPQRVQPTTQRLPTPTTPAVDMPAYTPTTISRQTTSIFKASPTLSLSSLPNIKDLHDALTGEALDLSRNLFQCNKCKVFYFAENYEILKEINRSKCVACGSTNIQSASETSKTSSTSVFNPSAVTLENYKQYAGKVVTFVGRVVLIRESQKWPGNFSVMFENESWVNGFKIFINSKYLDRLGGKDFINSLANKIVTVRGLIVKDATFGYQIVVTDKHMILAVE